MFSTVEMGKKIYFLDFGSWWWTRNILTLTCNTILEVYFALFISWNYCDLYKTSRFYIKNTWIPPMILQLYKWLFIYMKFWFEIKYFNFWFDVQTWTSTFENQNVIWSKARVRIRSNRTPRNEQAKGDSWLMEPTKRMYPHFGLTTASDYVFKVL